MRRVYLGVCILFVFLLLAPHTVFSELKEEKEEKALEVTKKRSYKLSARSNLFFGYDSNVELGSDRKGDIFQEFLYSLNFIKFWENNTKFTCAYNLDALNYGEFTNVSNILNRLRFGLHKDFSQFTVGTGYDVSMFYYHHSKENDFLYHKGFFYLAADFPKNIYHQVQFEAVLKDYFYQNALADTINTYQSKERRDERLSIGYSLGTNLIPKMRLLIRAKYSINDANARYVDFYDYESYRGSFSLDYKLSRKLHCFSDVIYVRKNYDTRTVTSRDYRQKDNRYTANLGLRYKLNKKNSLSLYFTYRENSSNDSLAEYSENIFTCGWHRNF